MEAFPPPRRPDPMVLYVGRPKDCDMSSSALEFRSSSVAVTIDSLEVVDSRFDCFRFLSDRLLGRLELGFFCLSLSAMSSTFSINFGAIGLSGPRGLGAEYFLGPLGPLFNGLSEFLDTFVSAGFDMEVICLLSGNFSNQGYPVLCAILTPISLGVLFSLRPFLLLSQ